MRVSYHCQWGGKWFPQLQRWFCYAKPSNHPLSVVSAHTAGHGFHVSGQACHTLVVLIGAMILSTVELWVRWSHNSFSNDSIVGQTLVFRVSPGQPTLNKLPLHWENPQKGRSRKKKGGKKWFVSPCMCAVFMLNDLYKHDWQAEKKNRIAGQEWNLKQQEIKCWIHVGVGEVSGVYLFDTTVGAWVGPKKPPQFPGGLQLGGRLALVRAYLPWRHDM